MTVPSIIRLPQVKARTGLSRTTIYALIKSGQFPSPVSLGARAIGWRSDAVNTWITTRCPSRGQTGK